jgi:hypothetical protein
MAYNNVNTRVRKLEGYGLIELTKDRVKPGTSKKYSLTSRGLFEILMFRWIYSHPKNATLRKNKNNIIIRYLLHDILELDSIDQLSGWPYVCFEVYLQECCQLILQNLNSPAHRGGESRHNFVASIRELIDHELTQLVTRVVREELDSEPLELLANDKKFCSKSAKIKARIDQDFAQFKRLASSSKK